MPTSTPGRLQGKSPSQPFPTQVLSHLEHSTASISSLLLTCFQLPPDPVPTTACSAFLSAPPPPARQLGNSTSAALTKAPKAFLIPSFLAGFPAAWPCHC